LINNRFDLLSEFDLIYKKDAGFRVSAAAWYDAVYTKSTNKFPTAGYAPNYQAVLAGAANNINTQDSKDIMGQHAEFRDVFVYDTFHVGEDSNVVVRVGQLTQLYGETLFLGANGIANAQGPVDLIKAYSQPNAQFKEIALPVKQITVDYQINPALSAGFYFHDDWKPLRLPAAGSYFSVADFVGAGGDLLLTPFANPLAFRQGDLKGSDTNNYGARVKFKVGDVDYGLYAARYDDTAPIPVVDIPMTPAAAANPTNYRLMYATGIDTYGGSFSTVFGETNVAGEISTRRNTPLAPAGDLIVSSLANENNTTNTPYARGNSLHVNFSAITVLPASSLWQGASFVGEFAFNRLLSVISNPIDVAGISALNTTHTRDSSVMRFVFQPEYFQVFPGVDLQVPIGVGYGLTGRSATIQLAPEHGGDLSVGVNADMDKVWKMGVHYSHYFGAASPVASVGNPATTSYASYQQFYADRDFVSFSVQRTF
jgi:hypothetical protein